MRSFFTVLRFEFNTMVKKRSFLVSTLIIVLGSFLLMSLPGLFQSSESSDSQVNVEADKLMLISDKQKVLNDKQLLKEQFPDYKIKFESEDQAIRNAIELGKADAGFIIHNAQSFTYCVKNSSLTDMTSTHFSDVLKKNYEQTELKRLNYNVEQIEAIYHAEIISDTEILGTDGAGNYFYTYVLVFLLYMMIIVYGNQIAVGVASEKSNRAIEILTTSCSPNALIFGKVIAGALAGVLQTAIIVGSVLVAYQMNAGALNHMLDPYLQIPSGVLATFALFGVLGYLLFSFILGAVGAMCSKVEEVNGATLPIQMIIIVVFILSVIVLQDPSGTLAKVMMYLPLSSWMCMFVNVAVSSVSTLEIAISLTLLAISTVLMGFVGAKLYRRGTLSYGNTLKFSQMLKALKHND